MDSITKIRFQSLDLDAIINLQIFPPEHTQDRKSTPITECSHIGMLVKDGFNRQNGTQTQRYKCSRCGKRFGIDPSITQFWHYKSILQALLYDLFFTAGDQLEMAKRYQIPQDMISRFKKQYITRLFSQHSNLSFTPPPTLSHGVIIGDETYFGTMGNSNVEGVFIDEKLNLLACGIVEEGNRAISLQKIFENIPQHLRERLRILVTDGEPSYKGIAMLSSHRTILVQQIHGQTNLGKVIVHKFENFGPHHLHYEIHTHWKIFKKGNHELKIKWKIRFIKDFLYRGRGRPRKDIGMQKKYVLWRQKKDEYESSAFKKEGCAKLFVNMKTQKITLRRGSKQWMRKMLQPLLPIFAGKCITSNAVECKHSQVKRKGGDRKQPDEEYGHQLFQLAAYLVEHESLPLVKLPGCPLYKVISKSLKTFERKKFTSIRESKSVQTVLYL